MSLTAEAARKMTVKAKEENRTAEGIARQHKEITERLAAEEGEKQAKILQVQIEVHKVFDQLAGLIAEAASKGQDSIGFLLPDKGFLAESNLRRQCFNDLLRENGYIFSGHEQVGDAGVAPAGWAYTINWR